MNAATYSTHHSAKSPTRISVMHDQIHQVIILIITTATAIFACVGELVLPKQAEPVSLLASSITHSSEQTPPQVEEVQEAVKDAIEKQQIIMANSALRTMLILGSIGGAVAGVCTFGFKNARELGLKLVGCGLIGIMFTPGLMRQFNKVPDEDTVLFWAPCVSIFGAAVLKAMAPAVVYTAKAILTRMFNIQFPPDDK